MPFLRKKTHKTTLCERAILTDIPQEIFNHWPSHQRGAYLCVPDCSVNIISIFDELRYDRADADLVSPAMRKHLASKLALLDFKQCSGTIFENKQLDIRCLIPKSHALGASPFDALRYTKKRTQDYYLLTSTQAACQLVDLYDVEEAVDKIAALISKQPINVNRIYDYLERNEKHQVFNKAIPHLRFLQRKAIESEPLRSMRALR